MHDTTKYEVIQEAIEVLQPLKEETVVNKKKFINNIASIISISAIVLTIILYAFNQSFCAVYNLPNDVISIDMVQLIPLAIRIVSMSYMILLYVSSRKTDKLLKKNRISLVRVIFGLYIISNILAMINIEAIIGKWWKLLIEISLPIAVEIVLFFSNKPRKNRIVSAEEKTILLEDTIKDMVFYNYYIKHGIFLIVLPIIIASTLGHICAKSRLDYQTFYVDDTEYAVVVDYTDRVLAQRIEVKNNNLSIYIDDYCYFPKEGVKFTYKEYDSVKLLNKSNNPVTSPPKTTIDLDISN